MFPLCKTKVDISAGFCLLAAWFMMSNGWQLLVAVLSAAAIHECGHWLVLRALGSKILRFQIGVLGAVLEADNQCLSYGGELTAVLAGPAANLLGAAVLIAGGFEMAAGAHVVLGAFNLLPIRPLDGGRALYLVTTWGFGPLAGERISRWIGAGTAMLLAAGLVWLMVQSGGSLWLLPAAFGAFAVVGKECFGK